MPWSLFLLAKTSFTFENTTVLRVHIIWNQLRAKSWSSSFHFRSLCYSEQSSLKLQYKLDVYIHKILVWEPQSSSGAPAEKHISSPANSESILINILTRSQQIKPSLSGGEKQARTWAPYQCFWRACKCVIWHNAWWYLRDVRDTKPVGQSEDERQQIQPSSSN